MNTPIYATQSVKKYVKAYKSLLMVTACALALVSFIAFAGPQLAGAQTFPSLTAQAGIGSKGTNVSNLQTFLASNPMIYPEGLVTGYYGGLTAQAVRNFQLYYGIDQVGNVGPITLAKLNSVIGNGYGLPLAVHT
jgi:peptidoglycan hydrolase-like protein with peptidoglycan-binding domain